MLYDTLMGQAERDHPTNVAPQTREDWFGYTENVTKLFNQSMIQKAVAARGIDTNGCQPKMNWIIKQLIGQMRA